MDELKETADIVGDTPYMSVHRATRMFNTIRSNGGEVRRMLEIGTYKGAGTCYLAKMGQLFGAELTTVDLIGNSSKHGVSALINKCSAYNVLLLEYENGAQDFFREHFNGEAPSYDFIYHDAAHNWTEATAIFAMAYAALSPGGLMAVDDIRHPNYPDLTLMWKKVIPHITADIYDTKHNIGWVFK